MKYLLGIESSCDETAAAILAPSGEILSNIVFSQSSIHNKTGGVVPEIASKNHSEKIHLVINEALIKANVKLKEIAQIFVSNGPGLTNCLMIGVIAAKALGSLVKIPVHPVNHIEGHIASCFIENKVIFPSLCLVASGGHSSIYHLEDEVNFSIIGSTIDDAAGEAFDKGAKLMGLGYPGGIEIDKLAKEGDEDFHKFPIAKLDKNSFNFSFSGIKTSLRYFLEKNPNWKNNIHSIAASYQESIVDSLLQQLIKARKKFEPKSILISGGVACNSRLREKAQKSFIDSSDLIIPTPKLCTDNAAMIAMRGIQLKRKDNLDYSFGVYSTSRKIN